MANMEVVKILAASSALCQACLNALASCSCGACGFNKARKQASKRVGEQEGDVRTEAQIY